MKFNHKIAGTLILLLTVCTLSAKAETLTDSEKTFDIVIEAPQYTKVQIYDGVKLWIAENFKSAKAVLDYDNKEAGTIIGNGNIPYPSQSALDSFAKSNWHVGFKMRIDIKDQKFRLTFSDIALLFPPPSASGPSGTPVWNKRDMEKIRPRLEGFGEEILAFLGKNTSQDNW